MDFDYTHDAVLRQFGDSLQRLGKARIDCLESFIDYSATTLAGEFPPLLHIVFAAV